MVLFERTCIALTNAATKPCRVRFCDKRQELAVLLSHKSHVFQELAVLVSHKSHVFST